MKRDSKVRIAVSAHELRRVAVLSVTDPRTLHRLLAGKPIRPTVRVRIENAMHSFSAGAVRDAFVNALRGAPDDGGSR